jgi:hypothetical protein
MGISDLFSIGGDDEGVHENVQPEQSSKFDETDPKRVTVPEEELVDIRRVNDDLLSGIYRVGQLVLEIHERWTSIIETINNLKNKRSDIADEIEAKFISEDSDSEYVLDFDTSGGDGELIRSDVYEKEPDGGVPVNQSERENPDPKGDDDSRPEDDIVDSS